MEYIGRYFELLLEGMKTEIVVYGYTISMWQVYVFEIVAAIILTIIGGFISE